MQRRDEQRAAAERAALAGVFGALSLLTLYISAIVPTGRLGLVAAAGIFPAGAVVSGGLSAGFFCYGAAGLLGLLLLPDKASALLYLLLFGLWPMMKSLIEGLRRLALEVLCKLLFLNGVLSLLWFGLRGVFLPFLPAALSQSWMVYLVGNVGFFIYDLGFSKLIDFYTVRVDKVLRKRG
ncbi:MAG: hypothetical protein HFF30_08540 [Flavonifractor sp.]|nr:hypothetical protein [Flavonifractor sp.]